MAKFSLPSLASYFNQRVEQFGPSTDALQWNSQYSQETRYHFLLNDLPAGTVSLCDVGCGCGDLYHYICKNKLPYQYVGLDISAGMIVAAQHAYPSGDFRCLRLDQCVSIPLFDVVVASGVFNLRLENHEDYVFAMIQQMLAKARYQVRFNMLSDKTIKRPKQSSFVYVNGDLMQQKLAAICDCHMMDGYLPNDVMFVCSK